MTKEQIVKIILLTLVAIVSFCLWLFLHWGFFGAGHHWFFIWLGPVICLFGLGVIFGFLVALPIKKWQILSAVAIILAFFVLFFWAYWYCWLAGLVAGIIIFIGSQHGLRQKGELIKLRFFRILRPAISALMSGLILVVACAWYASPLVIKSVEEIAVPRPLFNFIFAPFKHLLLNQITQSAFNFQDVPQLKDLMNLWSQETAGRTPAINEPELEKQLSDQIYQLTNEKIRDIVKLYQDYIALGLALALLAGLRALSIPLAIFMVLICWALLELLIKLGFLKVEQIPVQKEVLRI